MTVLSSLNEIVSKAKKAVQSFPITLIWAVIGTFFTVWFTNFTNSLPSVEFNKTSSLNCLRINTSGTS